MRVSNLVGRRWSFRTLWELRRGEKIRYKNLLESLKGISSSTLSDTLRYLKSEDLITRSLLEKLPTPKVEYCITQKGRSLLIASSPILKWAIQNNAKSEIIITPNTTTLFPD